MRRIVAMMTSTSPSAGSRAGIAVRPPTGADAVRLPRPEGSGPLVPASGVTVVDVAAGEVAGVGSSRTAGAALDVGAAGGDVVVVVVAVVVVVVLVDGSGTVAAEGTATVVVVDVVVVVLVVFGLVVVVVRPPPVVDVVVDVVAVVGVVVDVAEEGVDGSVSLGAAADVAVNASCTAQPARATASTPPRT